MEQLSAPVLEGPAVDSYKRAARYVRQQEKVRREFSTLLSRAFPLSDREATIKHVVEISRDPNPVVALPACLALLYFTYGKPHVNSSPMTERLDAARALFIEAQIAAGIPKATAMELESRSYKTKLEVNMWSQSLVTEEQQTKMIQGIAVALNRVLIEMTPEKYESLVAGKTPEEALESLKGYMGRSQSEIVADAMQYAGDRDIEDLVEDDEDGGVDDEGEEV
jgi:hypothetical protein